MDPWPSPSCTPRCTHSRLSKTTHTSLKAKRALTLRPRVSLEPSHLLPFQPEIQLNSRLPSLGDQSPLPLRPTRLSSKCTLVVFSLPPLAEPPSTTVSLLSVTEPSPAKTTSSSRTPGVLPGELLDTSRSEPPAPTSAVSSLLPPTQPSESYDL